jgi:hypothetical protein
LWSPVSASRSASWRASRKGCVDPTEPGSRVERAPQHLVHVDRAGDLPKEAAAPALLLGPLDRAGELLGELAHPLLEGLDDGPTPLVGGAPGPSADERQEHGEENDAAAEGRTDDDECVVGHRRKVERVSVWSDNLRKLLRPVARIRLNRPV